MSSVLLPILLVIIMFGLGLTLTIADFKRIITFPRAALIGLVCQLVLLPLVAFGLCHLFSLEPAFAIGLMVLSASPGGPTSNIYSKITGGDVALNLTLTAVNSVICAISMPFITKIAINVFSGDDQNIGFQSSKMVEVFFLILIPVLTGMLTFAKKPALATRLEKPIQTFSVVALVVIIVGAASKEWRTLVDNFAHVGWAVVAFNLISLATGYLVPILFKISKRQSTAIAFEIGIHNSGLALFVALAILNSTAIAVPAAIYSILMYFTAGALSVFLKSKRKS